MHVDDGPAGEAGLRTAEQNQRRTELQDFLNRRLYHPLAHQLARLLSRTPVTPNQVSVASGLCVVAAALAYTRLPWPQSVLAGLLLHMAWHVGDGADGDLARMTSRTSTLGETIDGICDYAGHVVLYIMLGYLLAGSIGGAAWPAMVAAGLSRVAQTNHFEVQRRLYQWRVYGTDWVGSKGPDHPGAFAGLLRTYLALADTMVCKVPHTDAALAAARGDPARLDALRRMVRAELAPPLGRLAPLGSNQRTLALGLSMATGKPLWYFLYEATLLNVLLALSIARHRRAALRLEEQAGQLAASTRR